LKLFGRAKIRVQHERVGQGGSLLARRSEQSAGKIGILNVYLEHLVQRPSGILRIGIVPHVGIDF